VIERLRTFFNFCVESGWIAKNPAEGLAPADRENRAD